MMLEKVKSFKFKKIAWMLMVCLVITGSTVIFINNSSVYAAQYEFYVSPTGNDTTGNGSVGSPWKTIGKARDHIRTNNLNDNMTGDIIVYFAQGDYEITSTVNFTVDDSGSNGYKVIYKNKDAIGSAVFKGSTTITGWTLHSGNIYKANVGTGVTNLKSIYENGKRARKARTPNYSYDSVHPTYLGNYLRSEGGSSSYIQYYSGDLNPSGWTLTGEEEIVWWTANGNTNWGMNAPQVTSIDTSSRRINFPTNTWTYAQSNERYFVQGIFELLDAAGEFYMNTATGWLYYSPMDGAPGSQTITVPKVEDLFTIQGSAVGTHAHDITFEGLYFKESNDDLFYLLHTDKIEFLNCHFKNSGFAAIKMDNDNDHNKVYGSWFEHLGMGAIMISNYLLRADYPNNKSEYHIISNCKFHDYTEYLITTHYAAVLLQDTNNCEVSYSEMYNAGRYATSVRGHYSTQWNPYDNGRHYSKDNVFKYLNVHDVAHDSGDMGAVHAAHLNATGGSNINYWEQIKINNIYANSSMDDVAPNGIFLDHSYSCQNQNLKNIKITNTQGNAFRTNYNPTQTLYNCSWVGGFNDSLMDYANIGIKSDFPAEYRVSGYPILINDNFNDQTTGNDPIGWTLSETGGDIAIAETPSTSNKSMKIWDNSDTDFIEANKEFTTISEPITVEFDFMTSASDQITKICYIYSGSTIAFSISALDDGYLKYYDGTNNNICSYSANTWYHFKVTADPSTDKMNIYVDDMVNPKITNGNFRNAVSSFDKFHCGSYGANLGYTSYWDNIQVYNTNLINDIFNDQTTGNDPIGWTLSETGGDIAIAETPSTSNKSMKIWDNSDTNFIEANKGFTTRSGPITVEFDFMTSASDQITKMCYIYSGSTIAFSISALNDGYFKYYDGTNNNICSYSANTWYHFKVTADPSTDKMNIYVDDMVNPKITNGNFRNAVSSFDKFHCGSYGANLGYTSYWDNIQVYFIDL